MKTTFELHQTLRQSREELAFLYADLREELKIPNLLRHSIKNHPWYWLSGAMLTGLSFLFFKESHDSSKKISQAFSSQEPLKEHKKNSSSEKSTLLTGALSLLNNNTIRSGLWSAAQFLFPLARGVATNYYSKRREKMQ